MCLIAKMKFLSKIFLLTREFIKVISINYKEWLLFQDWYICGDKSKQLKVVKCEIKKPQSAHKTLT